LTLVAALALGEVVGIGDNHAVEELLLVIGLLSPEKEEIAIDALVDDRVVYWRGKGEDELEIDRSMKKEPWTKDPKTETPKIQSFGLTLLLKSHHSLPLCHCSLSMHHGRMQPGSAAVYWSG
jgi:hypothetical protein